MEKRRDQLRCFSNNAVSIDHIRCWGCHSEEAPATEEPALQAAETNSYSSTTRFACARSCEHDHTDRTIESG